jgi:hypothetical protein
MKWTTLKLVRMNLLRRAIPMLALMTVLTACKSRDRGVPMQVQAQPGLASVSFHNDVYPVLAKNCASAEGCHGNNSTAAVDLDLRAPAAYSQLVGKDAEMRKGALRVRPGDPATSFLIAKLAGSLQPSEGNPMPINVETGEPFQTSPLPPDYIEKSLKPWIRAGAPNN